MKLKNLITLVIFSLITVTAWGEEAAQTTTIYLTRHAQTHWNAKKIWQGIEDTNLNLEGLKQAVEKGVAYQNIPVDAVYSSPLRRAMLTADIIAAVHDKRAIPAYGLIEPYLGILQGMHKDDVHALIHPHLTSLSQEERRRVGEWEGCESMESSATRVENELRTIAKRHPGKTVVAVSHSTLIAYLVGMHSDAVPDTISMSNMAFLKYTFDGKDLHLIEWSPDITYKTYQDTSSSITH